MHYEQMKTQVNDILSAKDVPASKKLCEVCELLQKTVEYYDWVGFYFADHDKQTLHLVTYCGDPTDHTVIPFGKGICGQVAVSNANFVVPNVQEQDNYISCSINVKSEVVIPLFKNGINIGQIDIDSHHLDPFTEKDERFLEWVNERVASIIEVDANNKAIF